MNWYLAVWKNYVNFSGRARRKEFWMFMLFNFIVAFVIALIDDLIIGNHILVILYDLALIIPGIALSFRRLHDIGKSAWWILISLIPIIGSIIILVFNCLDSEPGENKYGPNPK